MTRLLLPFLLLIIGLWAWTVAPGAGASGAWAIYDHSLFLSGLLSVALMSLAMMLALRPVWLERPLGGLDQIYRVHKWAGILAAVFAVCHWLVEMGDDLLESLFGRSRLHDYHFSGFVDAMRDAAEEVGEFAIYLVIALVLLTLWRQFPYKYWRYIHRAMPALYLTLAFHSVWLAPSEWWFQPLGMVMALLLAGGSLASVLSLTGRIGRQRQVRGRVMAVNALAPDITEVVCQMPDSWSGHQPGQFALVTFDALEGAHPFTIASADRGDGTLSFRIKALGDFTQRLSNTVRTGQVVRVEGPYGRFNFSRHNRKARQVWVAGGIGVTPFLAWLETLRSSPATVAEADLHYCTRNADEDPNLMLLRELCQGQPGIDLQVYDSSRGQALTARHLLGDEASTDRLEVWFCGPGGLGDALRQGLKAMSVRRWRFHQEAFQFR